jgi:hypothetical protein
MKEVGDEEDTEKGRGKKHAITPSIRRLNILSSLRYQHPMPISLQSGLKRGEVLRGSAA